MLPRRSKYFKKEVESKYFTKKLLKRPDKKEPNKRHGHLEQSSSDGSAGDCKPQRKSELLLNIERYNEIHPSHHVVNKRLIGRRGLFPYGIRTNICERKNLDPVYKANAVQNIENIISSVKSKSPETRVKFGTPNAASTGRRWLCKNTAISPIDKVELTYNNNNGNGNQKNDVESHPNVIGLLAACNKNPIIRISKKMPELITSNVLKSQVQALKSTLLTDQQPKTSHGTVANKSPEFDEMCNMYVEFVDSICEVVSSAHDKISPNDDSTAELYKRLRSTIVNSRRSSPRKQLRPTETLDANDKTTNSISNCFSAPNSANEDFVFKPVLMSSKAPAEATPAHVLMDSFELPIEENTNTNNNDNNCAPTKADDSLNFSKLSEMEVDEFSSPESSRLNKKRPANNRNRRRVSFLDSSSGQLNQVDKYDDGGWTSEDSFRCSNKKCFKM